MLALVLEIVTRASWCHIELAGPAFLLYLRFGRKRGLIIARPELGASANRLRRILVR
jgi:hypothetical protein